MDAMAEAQRKLESEKRALSRLIRRIDESTDKRKRGELVRELAERLIDLRLTFTTADGRPDISGRTFAYRSVVRDIYSASGVPRDRVQPIQALVRYHIGNVIRDRVGEEDIEDAGLLLESPLQRSKGFRDERMRVVRAVRGQAEEMDPLTVLRAVEGLLRRIRVPDVDALDDQSKREYRDLLSDVAHQVQRLLRIDPPPFVGTDPNLIPREQVPSP